MNDKTSLNVHLIAIGGSGMAPFACLLQGLGHSVRGSDGPLYPPMSTLLEEAGIEPMVGWDAAHLDPEPDLVVVGNAVHRDNPEAVEAERRGLRLYSMPQALGRFFLDGRRPLVAAGTHGKTTTSSIASPPPPLTGAPSSSAKLTVRSSGGGSEIIVDSNNNLNNTSEGYVDVSSNWTASSHSTDYQTGYWWAQTAAVSDGASFWFYMPTAGTKTPFIPSTVAISSTRPGSSRTISRLKWPVGMDRPLPSSSAFRSPTSASANSPP